MSSTIGRGCPPPHRTPVSVAPSVAARRTTLRTGRRRCLAAAPARRCWRQTATLRTSTSTPTPGRPTRASRRRRCTCSSRRCVSAATPFASPLGLKRLHRPPLRTQRAVRLRQRRYPRHPARRLHRRPQPLVRGGAQRPEPVHPARHQRLRPHHPDRCRRMVQPFPRRRWLCAADLGRHLR